MSMPGHRCLRKSGGSVGPTARDIDRARRRLQWGTAWRVAVPLPGGPHQTALSVSPLAYYEYHRERTRSPCRRLLWTSGVLHVMDGAAAAEDPARKARVTG